MRLTPLLSAALGALLLGAAGPQSATVRADVPASPGAYRSGEYDLVRNINPPGQTGFLSAADVAHHEVDSSYYAPHQDDQEGMYADLVNKAPNITAADVQRDYKDASFGVPAGQVASTETPRPGVTVIRDTPFGVPHIYGRTDDDLVFGAGWVLGEDRLFMTDVLRHYGRSTLASFIGSSGIGMDCAQKQLAGYTDAELQAQIDHLGNAASGEAYSTLAQQYVDGINAYIAAAQTDPTKLPAEYAAFGPPQPFDTGDIIAIAGLVGGIFGKGGGVETTDAAFLRALYALYGGPVPGAPSSDPTTANSIFRDLMESVDSAAQVTVDGVGGYENTVQPIEAPGAALTKSPPPAPTAPGGTCSVQPLIPGGPTSTGSAAASAAARERATTALRIVDAFAHLPHAMSNALLVDAHHSTTGRPIAVMGPQVGYYEPEILMEEDLHSPSFDVRGVSFPGTNFIVELGHGPDYAWSATSAGTDNIDQFAERLCNPDSVNPLANVDPASTFYLYNGRCTAMYERTDSETVLPSPGSTGCSPVPVCLSAETVTFKVERTVHGPVLGRTTALVGGVEVPVAIATMRTTFMHEADSVAGFAAFNDPALMTSANDFLVAASHINYVFNWFYADDSDIAYYQSGLLPIRAGGVSYDLPTWGTGQYDWLGGWNQLTGAVGSSLAFGDHCHAINPAKGWMVSWNNKGCPGFRASDDQWSYGPVFRSQSLADEISRHLASGGGRMSLVDLVNSMENAATVDLRATQDLPLALAIIGSDPTVASHVQLLSQWVADGGHRRVTASSNGVYDHVKAIELLNAWWDPPNGDASASLLHAIFDPALKTAFSAVPEELDNRPGPRGSAYIEGWYGYVQKALRDALGAGEPRPFSVPYCGGGSLSACRAALVSSLSHAAAAAAAGPDDATTTTQDDIRYSGVGLGSVPPMTWQNRPTFQQVVDVPGHRPRPAPPGASVSGANASAPIPTPNTGTFTERTLWPAAIVVAMLVAVGRRRRSRR